MRLMQFGFALPGRGPLATPEALTKLAEKVDALRYASVFVTDHVVIPTSYSSPYPYAASGRFSGDWTNGYLEPMAMMGVLVPYAVWLPLALLASTLPAFYVVLDHTVRQHRWHLSATLGQRRAGYYDWLLTSREGAA